MIRPTSLYVAEVGRSLSALMLNLVNHRHYNGMYGWTSLHEPTALGSDFLEICWRKYMHGKNTDLSINNVDSF